MGKNIIEPIIIIILVFGAIAVLANNDIEKLKKEATTELASERYHNAKELLKRIVAEDPEDAWFHYSLGISCLHTSSFETALTHLKKAYEIDPISGVDDAYSYWLGRAYHQNHQFDLAVNEYANYLRSLNKSDKARNEILTLINQAYNGERLMSNPNQTLIVPFENGTNSVYDDHSPIIGDNGSTIYYTSKMKLHEEALQDKNGDYYETVFVTQKNEMGVWSVPQSIRKRNNEQHEACIQLFGDDNQMLAYRGEDKGKIFMLKKDHRGNWFTSDQLIEINNFGTDGHATVSDDGNMIIFSKKAKGLFRQDSDLYYCSRNNWGFWGEPQPLGEPLNTTFDETSPFLSPDGKSLYFSSNNEKSMGGFDIFKSTLLPGGYWSVPENLGYPINTAHHDLYYQENRDKTIATFASHREEGKGQLDIYMAYNVQMVNVIGTVSNNNTAVSEELSVYFNSEGEIQHPFSAQVQVAADGTFEKQLVSDNAYRVFVTQGNKIIKEEVVEIEKTLVKGESVKYVILLTNPETAKTSEEMLASEEIGSFLEEGYGVSMVLFEYNKTELSKNSREILQAVLVKLNQNKELKVALVGHSDEIGSEEYNLKLSASRAEMAAEYLQKQGIAKHRIITKGMGEKEPITKGSSAIERAKNRRLEISIY